MAITIIGYRGTGKSTVGSQLAARLGWSHVDTDPEIERTAGKSIAAIFEDHGEPYFRQLESGELSRHLNSGEIVVSTGGGAILREENRQLMQQAGPVVWLMANVETIAERIQGDPSSQSRRPSLTGADPTAEIQTVLAARWPLYDQTATLAIQTDHRSPESIVDEILASLPGKILQKSPTD